MWNEIRIALRTLRKARGFTVAALLVVALCVGANTAVFSIVHGVLWKPLPFRDPVRLVSVTENLGALSHGEWPMSAPDYLFLAEHAQSFESIAAYTSTDWELSGTERIDRIRGARVSPSLFSTLGAAPLLGRTFTEQEDREGRQVAVLNGSYWRRAFGSRSDILGRTIYLDRKPYTVIGVMNPGFVFPLRQKGYNGNPADVYVPISWTDFERKGFGYMYNKSVLARLKPGVPELRAAAEVKALMHQFQTHYPADFQAVPGYALSGSAISYEQQVTGRLRNGLVVLLCALALVLLIGCANVANLLLARSVERRREFAVRASLGAARSVLLRQNFIESFVLSLVAGGCGLLLAAWLTPALIRMAPVELPRLEEVSVDRFAFLFTLAICSFAAFLFGLGPALASSRLDLVPALREGGRTSTRSGGQKRWMSLAIVFEYALTLVLLIAAGLLMRSFVRLRHVDPGFSAQHVLSLSIKLPNASYKSPSDILSFYDRLLRSVRELPGVDKAGAISDLPLTSSDQWGLAVEGKAPESGVPRSTLLSWVSGDAMDTLQFKILRGRLLGEQDLSRTGKAVVVNETMARQAWPGGNPIGKRLGLGGKPDSDAGWVTVVGVVADLRQGLANLNTRPQVFQPHTQASPQALANMVGTGLRGMHIVIRTSAPASPLLAQIRHVIANADPALPVTQVETLTDYLDNSIDSQRFDTYLMSLFAGLALLLAVIGIGGVLWYSVVQRTNELGVRMALGGSRTSIVQLVLTDGVKLAAIGMLIGIVAAVAVMRFLASLLYQTSTFDAATVISVVLFLALATVTATLIPAWRATRIDPMTALRSE